VSLEDEFVSRYAKNIIAYLKKRHAFNTDGISSNTTRAVFRLAQRRAEKLALRQRKSVMRTDHWLEEQLSFSGKE
jgi:preprotein translocase subunit SecA